MLEAVDELPLGGTPIPASAQKRVEQFLVKQINSGPPAVSCSSSPGQAAKPPCVRPKGLQDTKQLREFLQKHVETSWVSVASTGLTPVVTAALQLVAESAHRVARQQVIEKKSQAYTILLDEGYRAGAGTCLCWTPSSFARQAEAYVLVTCHCSVVACGWDAARRVGARPQQ